MASDYIYLDNNATTPLDPRVLEVMMPYLTDLYGNASSSHQMGSKIKNAVEKAREQVGDMINANPEDIIFTAGATEAINIALQGLVKSKSGKEKHIITVQTEHPAMLDTCAYLESIGVQITYLPVDQWGEINMLQAEAAITEDTMLISAMFVNNETGVMHNVMKLSKLAHKYGVLFMTDATQAIGKIKVDVQNIQADILVLSAHKFYGPKGVGALYLNPRLKIETLIYGGGHERGLRSGTLNAPAIIGMGKAAELVLEHFSADLDLTHKLTKKLEDAMLDLKDVSVNGQSGFKAFNTTNLCFHGIDNELILLNLKNICVSNGSACHSFTIEPSHVLLAMGLSREDANSSIRFSTGRFTTEDDIDQTIFAVQGIVKRLRAVAV